MLVTTSSSASATRCSITAPVRCASRFGIAITRGRTVAICGRYSSVWIVHSSVPPKVGRVAARLRVSSSMRNSVQSAVRPVPSVVATAPARSRPSVVAPSSRISGWLRSTSSVSDCVYGSVR